MSVARALDRRREPIMTRITTECPQCGPVPLGVEDVTLVVSPLEAVAWYLFDCASCARQVSKPASAPVITALGRVHVRVVTVPAEVLERAYDVESEPALGVDALLDLMLSLRTHDHLADLLMYGEAAA
jgi:hypothetical protein